MTHKRVAVIMAGGSGERFWPLSTADQPKQLLDLTGSGKSLLTEAADRARPLFGEHIFVSTSLRLAQAIADAGVVPAGNVLAEPMKRNTLGALIWSAAELARAHGPELTLAILTADHRIYPDDAFRQTVETALVRAESTQGLVTLGVKPTRAETGYGYIEVGDGGRVERFREKPNQDTAEAFVRDGSFLWNSGMFFWTFAAFRRELEHADPLYAQVLDRLVKGENWAFEELPNLSIDYALMERAERVYVLPAEFEWDDLGAWDSLRRTLGTDEHGNSTRGLVRLVDCQDCIVYNLTDRRVNLLGLHDQIVVITEKETVCLPASRAQEVRTLCS